MYKAIFFDIDDSLLDFGSASRSAFYKSFEQLNLYVDDDIFQQFKNIDAALWMEQKAGLLSVNDVIDLRFKQLLSVFNMKLDYVNLRDLFQYHLSLEAETEYGAHEILEYLHDRYELYVASNGILAMQQSRLKIAKFLTYFSKLFVSNDIGFEKPDPNFFEICLAESQLSASDILFVGDSLEADMKGASNYGIDVCWYNPTAKSNHINCSIHYTIRSLLDLKEIL